VLIVAATFATQPVCKPSGQRTRTPLGLIVSTRLIYYNVTAIKVMLSLLVVLIHPYFFLLFGGGGRIFSFKVRLKNFNFF
jgi:hypothetical protein